MMTGEKIGLKLLLLQPRLHGKRYGKDWKILPTIIRLTSSGPPPSSPLKYGSFSYKYDKFMSRWPKAHAIHRMVVDGSRWCFSDIKTYIRVKRELYMNKRNLSELSMSELEILIQRKRTAQNGVSDRHSTNSWSGRSLNSFVTTTELPKLMAVMILLPLPLTIYLIGFAIIFFPRLILTRHFWSDSQRKMFFSYDINKSMTKGPALKEIIGNPSSVSCINLPEINELPLSVVSVLSSIHSLYPLPGISRRLSKRCEAMRELDKRLYAEIDNLTIRQLYFQMYIRRIDYKDQSEYEMRDMLRRWLKFTSHLENSAYLCAPVFFNRRNA